MDKDSINPHQNHLGVNKLGKNIRKIPNHQQQRIPPSQPRVYNVSKSDFRSVVQQLTGSPNRDSNGDGYPLVPARPPQPKNPSSRLKKIRPPPLSPIARLPPPPFHNQVPNPNPNLNPNNPSPSALWFDSPVSAYMKNLDESSLLMPDSSRQGLFPFPHPAEIADRGNPNSAPLPPWQPALFPSPGRQFPLISPGSQFPLSSPNSQFPLPSPSSFLNVVSPRSPYRLVSPRFQYSAPMTPNFSYLQLPQSGGLGPSPGVQPLPSPSNLFPISPSGSLPFSSPRWREK